MENKLSPEAIKVIKNLYKALLLTHERLADVVYASEDNYGEDKLERTKKDIEQLCEHYPWLCELGRSRWVGILTLRICLSELDSSLNILSICICL